MTTSGMNKALISHGARDEVFVMGDLGFEVNVAALISRINLAPREELDVREGSTAALTQLRAKRSSELPDRCRQWRERVRKV